MSDLAQILARARRPGQLVERRHFTLNREQAIEKLRQSALRRSGQVVLELVQCAVFAGASYIAIDTRRDQLVVAWVGTPPLEEDQLEHLLDYLFADASDLRQRHLVQLAIAANAMLKEDGGRILIESGNGQAGKTRRLDLSPDGEATLGVPDSALAGTYIALQRAPRWWRFWERSSHLDERELVEEQCRYTPVPILLNGTAPFGYRSTRQVRTFHQDADFPFDEGPGGRRGSLHLTPREGRIELVVGGVRITTVELPELGVVQAPGLGAGLPHRFSGVVCDDRLRKTADQADIVRDQRFQDLLQALRTPSTELARTVDRGWSSPLAEAHPTADGPRALPTTLDQLVPRPPCSLEAVRALPATLPVFSVPADMAASDSMQRAADPSHFPFPVFVLDSEGSALLEGELGRPVGRLVDAASVSLAARAAANASVQVVVEGRIPDPFGRAWGVSAWRAELLRGMAPSGAVPVLERRDGQTLRVRTVQLDAPGLCIHVDGPLPEMLPDTALLDLVLRHPVRIALGSPRVPLVLRCRLAALVLRVLPTEPHGVRIAFPPGWNPASLGVKLDAWCRAMQAHQRIVVPPDILEAWAPIEQRFGVGYLGTTPHGKAHCIVARAGDHWVRVEQVPVSGVPAWIAWDGPPPPDQPGVPVEPFLTCSHPLHTALAQEGAQALLVATRASTPRTPHMAALQERWSQGLCSVLEAAASGKHPRAVDARPHHSVHAAGPGAPPVGSAAVLPVAARFPSWVHSRSVPGGWAAFREFDEGWLGIPLAVTPTEIPPAILVDTGLRLEWRPLTWSLPCVGVWTEGDTKVPLWPALLALWSDLLEHPKAEAAPWVAYAARVVPPGNLMAERLAQYGQPATHLDQSPTQQKLLASLHDLFLEADSTHLLLEDQCQLLRDALTGPRRPAGDTSPLP